MWCLARARAVSPRALTRDAIAAPGESRLRTAGGSARAGRGPAETLPRLEAQVRVQRVIARCRALRQASRLLPPALARARAAHSGCPTRASCRPPARDGISTSAYSPRRLTGRSSSRIWRDSADRHRALDHALELADVAGPVVGHQRIDRGRRHRVARRASWWRDEEVLRRARGCRSCAAAAAARAPRRRSGDRRGRRGTAPSVDQARQRPVRRRDDARCRRGGRRCRRRARP